MKHGLKKQRHDCPTKIRHHSEAKARGSAWAQLSRSGSSTLLWPYRCVRCDGWHLTSSPTAGGPPISRHHAVDFARQTLQPAAK